MTRHAELSSLSTTLDELTRRVTALAEQSDADHDEDLAAELTGWSGLCRGRCAGCSGWPTARPAVGGADRRASPDQTAPDQTA